MMKKVLSWLNANLDESLLCLRLAAMAIIMGNQFISRYALNTSLNWSEEIIRCIFVWWGFLSVSYFTSKCISIENEQFAANLNRRTKAGVKVFNHTEGGTQIVEVSDVLRDQIRQTAQPVYEEIREAVSPELFDLYTSGMEQSLPLSAHIHFMAISFVMKG